MSAMTRRAIVVTGASTGIGAACVETLIGAGFFVFGSLRRQEDADRLVARFGSDFSPLLFDVTDGDAIARAAHAATSSEPVRLTVRTSVHSSSVKATASAIR